MYRSIAEAREKRNAYGKDKPLREYIETFRKAIVMKRLLVEKFAHNSQKDTSFSNGYVTGVIAYQSYNDYDKSGKQTVKDFIAANSKAAKSGDDLAKGVMCGVRDAANERKKYKGGRYGKRRN